MSGSSIQDYQYNNEMESVEKSDNITYMQSNSNRSYSPILKRTSESFDYNYDSISAISGSTVADSEYVAQQIRNYEKLQSSSDSAISSSQQPNVYNLRIDKVVIDGANKKKELDKGGIDVDQIFSNFTKSKDNFKKKTKLDQMRQFFSKKKTLVPFVFLLITLIGLSVILPVLFNDRGEPNDSTTDSTTNTEDNESSTSPNDDSTSTTSTSTTTTGFIPPPLFYTRSIWDLDGFGLQGKYKQLTPINKMILINIETNSCTNEQSCIDFIVDLQQTAYPEFEDIQVNFLVGFDGTIFEGRGFTREGETSFDTFKTSYNGQAISFGFMVNSYDNHPNVEQQLSLCKFISASKTAGDLSWDLKFFHHQSLISSTLDYPEFETCAINWTTVPNIFKRFDWGSSVFSEDIEYFSRRKSSNVIIATRGRNCDTIDTCKAFLQELQESRQFEFNFVLGGNKLIFEGRNFDVAPNSDLFDSLLVLVASDISTTSEGEEVMSNILEIIDLGVNLGKVEENYKLYGERQISGNSSSPGDVLFEIIQNHAHFEEIFESTCYEACNTNVGSSFLQHK